MSYWLNGKQLAKAEFADPVDLHASFLYLSRGTRPTDNNALFRRDGSVLGSYVHAMGVPGAPISESLFDDLMRSSLWFHPSLGDFSLLALTSGTEVRVIATRGDSSTLDEDRILPRASIDAVLIEAGSFLGAIADRVVGNSGPQTSSHTYLNCK